MGRGDNRRTKKVRQRKSWRRLKARLKKKMTAGAAAKGKTLSTKKPVVAKPTATVTRRTTET